MYKIIGADGKEYGPISAEQLRQWINQGRVNNSTKVKGETDSDWQTLGTLPDFASTLANPPPPLSAGPAATTTAAPKTSALAISSLVLGILGLFTCGFTALIGLILGIIGFTKIKKSQGRLSGSGLAIAGIVVSAIFVLMLPIFAAMLLPALAKAKAKAQSIQCMNNAKQIALGVIMYADANTNMPTAATWCDAVLTEVGSERVFQCGAANKEGRSHYAYNTNLDGFDLNKVKDPATTVLIFESTGGWNLSGGRELLLQNSRHNRKIVVGFVDGHVEQVNESDLSRLNWEP